MGHFFIYNTNTKPFQDCMKFGWSGVENSTPLTHTQGTCVEHSSIEATFSSRTPIVSL